jgi:hypothetical protein
VVTVFAAGSMTTVLGFPFSVLLTERYLLENGAMQTQTMQSGEVYLNIHILEERKEACNILDAKK